MQAGEIRVGVVGMGNMGATHARQIVNGAAPGLVLTAVCDTDTARLAPWRSESGVEIFTDFSKMLQNGKIDAVLIVTPHYSHTTFGIEALQAGFHVLVDKPISVHKADCERLIAAYKGGSQVFAAMFNQRTDPSYQKLKQMIDTGELGEIHRINWIITDWYRTQAYYNSGGWRATWAGEGGGVLLNQCPHQLDLYQWIFGMPKSVRAFCQIGRFHDIEVEDNVTAYMEHPSGATGVFITTTGEAPGTNRLEVAGERGKVVIEGGKFTFIRNEEPTNQHIKTCSGGFTMPGVWEINIPIRGKAEQHVGILKNFAAACLKGEKLLAPAAEGIHSVELANAMLFSSALGQTIELPMDAGAYEAWLKEKIAGSSYKKKESASTQVGDFSNSF